MAQRVQMILEDDIDGSAADGTVEFHLDGTDYEIDLSDAHADELREALAGWVAHARRIGGRRAPRTKTTAGSTGSASTGRSSGSVNKPAVSDKEQLAAMREWGQANGYMVSARGRVSATVRDAYQAAGGKNQPK